MMQHYKKLTFIFLLLALTVGGWWVTKKSSNPQTPQKQAPVVNDSAQIISTKPDPLNEAIVPADQTIEFTFNKPLQNVPEFKVRIEPKVEFKVSLSSDRKTATIKFIKPLDLGTAYTLTINPDTKFDGVGEWGLTKDFHFRTITYKGV